MKLRYFAWVRERIGTDEEEIALPAGVETVADLLLFLRGRGEGYEAALQMPGALRVALDQEHADHSEMLGDVCEVAIFPPMTGG